MELGDRWHALIERRYISNIGSYSTLQQMFSSDRMW